MVASKTPSRVIPQGSLQPAEWSVREQGSCSAYIPHLWLSTQDGLPTGEHLAMPGDISDCHVGRSVILVPSGWKSGMLLSILQGTGQSPSSP